MRQKVASAALVQALDGSGLYTPERNLAIFERVPPELRLTEFSSRTLPDHPAFHWRLEGRATWRGFDLGPLPEPMHRDFAYCPWRVIDSGLQITAQRALEKIIDVLKQPELTEHPDQAVRGPGTSARAANQPTADQT